MERAHHEPRRVLFFLPDLFSPPSKGYQVRCLGIAEGLSSQYSVRLISSHTSQLADGFGAETRPLKRARSVLISLTRGLPIQCGLFDGPDVAAQLEQTTKDWKPDVVVVITERLPFSLGALERIPHIVDAVDPMELQMAARAARGSWLLSRIWLRESRSFHRNADRIRRCATRVVVASRTGTQSFPGAVLIENAAAVDSEPRPTPTIDLVFTGNLSYWPNVKAALEICELIAPRVLRAMPHARIVIAGRNPVRAIRRACAAAGVELRPDVPSLGPVLRAARVALAPIEWTPGGNLKIYEALAAGTPVLAYPAAAAEVGSVAGMIVCDGADHLAKTAVQFLTGSLSIERFDRAAHTWPSRAAQFESVLDDVLS